MPDGRPWPTVSIVTPSYNQAAFLEETIRSILLQGYPALEYVVLDGGSSDGSLDILQRYAPWLSHWESARDGGQSQAINRGFALTNGAIFQWINSDDYLSPAALRIVAERCPEGGMLGAAVRIFGHGPEQVFANRDLTIENLVAATAIFVQPGVWMSRSLAERVYPLDPKLQFSFDQELIMRASLLGRPTVYDSRITTHFRMHPDSKTVSRAERFRSERVTILTKLVDERISARVTALAERQLRHMAWVASIDAIRSERRLGGSLRLAAEILRSPAERANRYSLGALRRELWRDVRALVSREIA